MGTDRRARYALDPHYATRDSEYLNLYFQSPTPIDRATTMALLRDRIDEALGIPLWIHPAPWLEKDFEDCVAVDRDSKIYLLRWMEQNTVEPGTSDSAPSRDRPAEGHHARERSH